MAWLQIRRGGVDVLRYRVTGARLSVGRGDTADIALPSEFISRIHATITHTPTGWRVRDEGSQNGLLVDDVPTTEAPLPSGAVLRLGEYELTLHEDDATPRDSTVVLPRATWEEIVAADGVRAAVRRALALIVKGPFSGKLHELRFGRGTVGGLGASVVLDADLPADACKIFVVRGRVMVERGSLPVFVDGDPVSERTPVMEGETVRVGEAAFEVRVEVREPKDEGPEAFGDLVGRTPQMRQLFGLLDRVARHHAPVLLTGESGTGKELAARALHDGSPRGDGAFVAINCGAIPPTLIESHLFGHEKGAFTGADGRQDGAFQRAHKGTLFLDELGELPLDAQVRLLRVLESGEVMRIGGSRPEHPDVRVIAATHRSLQEMVERGTFRRDLYYRLAVLTVRLPPLREHRADVPDIAAALLRRHHPGARLTPAALEKLLAAQWPGNVRELRNVLTRAVVLGGLQIEASALTFDADPAPPTVESGPALSEEAEKRAILDALARARMNRSAAARMLGIPRTSLAYKMLRYGIEA